MDSESQRPKQLKTQRHLGLNQGMAMSRFCLGILMHLHLNMLCTAYRLLRAVSGRSSKLKGSVVPLAVKRGGKETGVRRPAFRNVVPPESVHFLYACCRSHVDGDPFANATSNAWASKMESHSSP